MEHRLSQTRGARGILLADGFPPQPPPLPRRPALRMARGVRLRLSTTIPENEIGNQSPPHKRFPPSLLPTFQPPVPGPRTQLLVPLSPPPPTPVGHRRGRSCPGPRRGGVSGPTHRRPNPAQLQDPGAVCGPRPLCGPDCGPPAEMRTPPPPLPEPATQLQHTKPHRGAAAALCAPTRPGPAREAEGGGARREPVGSRRTGTSAAPGSLTR